MPTHIPFETILALAAGELDPALAAETERQIAGSADAATLQRLRAAIQTLRTDDTVAASPAAIRRALSIFQASPARSWLGTVKAAIASLVYDSRLQPALAGFRSAQETVQLAFASELAEIDLQLEPTQHAEKHEWRVTGQVAQHEMQQPISVRLLASETGTTIIEMRADEHGMFTLNARTGRYEWDPLESTCRHASLSIL